MCSHAFPVSRFAREQLCVGNNESLKLENGKSINHFIIDSIEMNDVFAKFSTNNSPLIRIVRAVPTQQRIRMYEKRKLP